MLVIALATATLLSVREVPAQGAQSCRSSDRLVICVLWASLGSRSDEADVCVVALMNRPAVLLMFVGMQHLFNDEVNEPESDPYGSSQKRGSIRYWVPVAVLVVVMAGWLSLAGLDVDLWNLRPVVTGLPPMFFGLP